MIYTQKLPHLVLIVIAAIITFQRCRAYCAKYMVQPYVDHQSFCQRVFINRKKCREIVKTLCASSTSSPEPDARPSSPVPIPIPINTALSIPANSTTRDAPAQFSGSANTMQYKQHLHDALNTFFSSLFRDELIKIIESYTYINWFSSHNQAQIIDILPLSEPAWAYDAYLILPVQGMVSLYDCQTNKEITNDSEKEKILKQAHTERKKTCELSKRMKETDQNWIIYHNITCIAQISDTEVATGCADGRILVCRLSKYMHPQEKVPAEQTNILTIQAHDSSITALALLSSGNFISGSKSDGPIRIWNKQGDLIEEIRGLTIPKTIITPSGELNIISGAASVEQLLVIKNKFIVIFDCSDAEPDRQTLIIFPQLI